MDQRLVFGDDCHLLRYFSEWSCVGGRGKEVWFGDGMAVVLSHCKASPGLEVLIPPSRLVVPTLGALGPWISVEILQRSASKHSQFKICLTCVCTTASQIYSYASVILKIHFI